MIPESSFPKHHTTGRGLSNLRKGDESIIWLDAPSRRNAASVEPRRLGTKITMAQHGTLLSADLYTRFRLPSGDEGTLTISNSIKKRNELASVPSNSRAVREEKQAFNNIAEILEDVLLSPSFSYKFSIMVDEHEVNLVVPGA